MTGEQTAMKLPLRKDADGLLRIHVEEEAADDGVSR